MPTRRELLAMSAAAVLLPRTALAQAEEPVATTLFTRVKLFDGFSPTLSGPVDVLVRGNVIEEISAESIQVRHRRT